MDTFLKRVTPLVLLVLAGLVILESWFPTGLGSDAVLRVVVAVLCVYVLLLVTERQAMSAQFTRVLETFKQFYAARVGAAAGEDGAAQEPMDTEQAKKEALPILLAALESDDPEVRKTAHDNLQRLTGKELDADPGKWRAELNLPKSSPGKDQGK